MTELGHRRVYGLGNRLLSRDDTSYVWDDDGRLLEKREKDPAGRDRTWKYQWTAQGQLAAVDRPELRVEMIYDPFGRRLLKRVFARGDDGRLSPVSRTRFIWASERMIQEITRKPDGAVTERVYGRGGVPRAHAHAAGRALSWSRRPCAGAAAGDP
jgi:YD repeat-containing protein